MENIVLDKTITKRISDFDNPLDLTGYGFENRHGVFYIAQCLSIDKLTQVLSIASFKDENRTFAHLALVEQDTDLHPAAVGSFGGEVFKQDVCAWVNTVDRRCGTPDAFSGQTLNKS